MANLYLSGLHSLAPEYKAREHQLYDYRLLTTHKTALSAGRKWLKEFQVYRDTREIGLMFDSGAFTVWTQDEPDIDVKDLLQTYKRAFHNLKDKFKEIWFINLDKIPGKISRSPTQEEISEAIRISDENFRVLSGELGHHILPVFHRSESPARLQEVIGMNPEYICISPKTDGAERIRREWSQRVLDLCHGTRTHGLAATGSLMLCEVPWYSVDSSSWLQVCAFGNVMIPNSRGGFSILPVSEHNPKRRNFGQHLDTIGKEVFQIIESICNKLQLTITELRTRFEARSLFNIYVCTQIATQGYKATPIQTTLIEL